MARRTARELLSLLPDRRDVWSMLVAVVANNLGFKVLSLFVALGIWGFVQGEREVVDVARVQVQYLLPESVAFSRRPQDRLKLSVSGPQNRVRELKRRTLSLEVDLRESTPGSPIVDFSTAEIQGIPPELTVLNLVPNSIQVELERKVVRQLTLKPQTTGTLPEGYRLASITLNPPAVEVSGAASAVERRDELSIQGVDLKGLTETGRIPVSVALPPGLERTGDEPIFAELTLELRVEQRIFEAVEVSVLRGGWEASLETLQVTLEGPRKDLDAIAEDNIRALVVVPKGIPPQQITVRRDPDKAARFKIDYDPKGLVDVSQVRPNSFTVEPVE